jgi:SAM-dependent methyltransferase
MPDTRLALSPFGGVRSYVSDLASPAFHAAMLRNHAKYRLFDDALARIAHGRRVLDIGTGSGILAILAVRAGAAQVVAVERPGPAEMARAVFAQLPDDARRIQLIEADVFELDALPAPFDVILSETIGYLGFEENIAAIMAHASAAFGTDRCALVPGQMKVGLHPIVDCDERVGGPYLTTRRCTVVDATRLSSSAATALGLSPRVPITVEAVWRCRSQACVDGVVATFSADLIPGITLSNHHGADWPRYVMPLPRALRLERGDTMQLTLRLCPSGDAYAADLRVEIEGKIVTHAPWTITDARDRSPAMPRATIADVTAAVGRLLTACSSNMWRPPCDG